MRVIAVDYGEKRLGLAVGDTETKIASPLVVIENRGDSEVIRALSAYVADENAERIVLGLPTTLDGRPGPMAKMVKNFAEKLEQEIGIKVDLEDERFSSRLADTYKHAGATAPRDTLAAAAILEVYLEKQGE